MSADSTRPLVTFYDDATGERVELSVATFDNWVAKTANLLRDGLGAEPGSRVGLLLPLHWQTSVWLVACWAAGVVAVPQAIDTDVVVAGPDHLENATAGGAVDVVGLSLAPLGRPLPETPPGVLDYAIEVRGYSDRFEPYLRPTADSPALEFAGRTYLHRDLLDVLGLRSGDRLLTTLPADTIDGVRAAIAAPVAAGASVVLCRNLDGDRIVQRMIAERVSAVAGEMQDVPAGVRRIG
jgi:uncharacterized protein (TIGR03089 family)